ncbi:Uncharacterized protein RNJ44_00966 [Nakaseomyces bracarensis]|uniref:RRM domain-containing protein n=1 Tax=Nakaseomyces bracarensis TaxID=273131 RepID=A0ABR4NQM5_9SACH
MARKTETKNNKYAGKSLVDRIGRVNNVKTTPKLEKKNKAVTAGLTVVNGKLLKADDLGVLLRAAGTKSTNETKSKKAVKPSQPTEISRATIRAIKRERLRNNLNSTKGRQARSPMVRKSKLREAVITANNVRSSRSLQAAGSGSRASYSNTGNTLVISTNTAATDKSLILYNLTLGVNQNNLRRILENLASVSIKRVRVRDLPTGSATAHVWLNNATIEELERVRKLFHGALVDGRTIQVVISSESNNNLSY